MKELRTIEFKCPLCQFEWNIKAPDGSPSIKARQKCPKCNRYSDNCYKPFNPWAAMMTEKKNDSYILLQKV